MSISKMSEPNSIDYGTLFTLSDPLASRPLRLEPREQDWLDVERALLLWKGEWQPPEPVLFNAYMGGAPEDFLWSGFPPLVCISQRVVELLKENRFIGWATYPVDVYGRHAEPLPGYYGLAITSYAGERDFTRSQIITKPPVVPKGKPWDVHKGLYFDESRWDGSDMFRAGGYEVVTSRVRQVFKRAKVTNVLFTPLLDVETDVANYRIRQKRDNTQ